MIDRIPRHTRALPLGSIGALAGVVVAQALLNWHFASQSFFYADDFVAFQNAVTGNYGADYLFAIHGGHLSPGRRAVTLFLQFHATLDFRLALAWLLACHSISVVLVARILRLVFGERWWTLAVAFAYGISIVIQPALQWFSAGTLIVPSTMFGLAAIHAYLCWWRTGRRAWLLWSAVAVTGGLALYIKALLVPLYIVAIRALLLDPDTGVRQGVRAAAREWRIWLVYAVPVAGALAVYLAQGYGDSAEGIALDTILDYFRTAWTAGFVPALAGVRVPVYGDSVFHAVAVVGCQVALIAAAAFSIARRRSAWRPWALLVLVFLLNASLVFPRLNLGSVIGYELRYFAESAYFAAIVIPFAFARPLAEMPAPGPLRLPRPAVLAPAAAALAAYVAFAWASDAAFTRHWPGRQSRAWVENLRDDLAALSARHVDPVLLNDAVPPYVLPFWVETNPLLPANSLAAFVPAFHPGLRYEAVSDRTYRVRADGHTEAVEFRPAADVTGRGVCLGRDGQPDRFDWRAPAPLRGRAWYLQATYRTGSGDGPLVVVDRGARGPQEVRLAPQPQGGASLLKLSPYEATSTVAGMRIAVAARQSACLTRFAVGSYVTG